MVWSIWSQRNQIRLHQPSCSSHLLDQNSKDCLEEFQVVKPRLKPPNQPPPPLPVFNRIPHLLSCWKLISTMLFSLSPIAPVLEWWFITIKILLLPLSLSLAKIFPSLCTPRIRGLSCYTGFGVCCWVRNYTCCFGRWFHDVDSSSEKWLCWSVFLWFAFWWCSI